MLLLSRLPGSWAALLRGTGWGLYSLPVLCAELGDSKGKPPGTGETRQPVGVSSLEQFKQVRGTWVLQIISPSSSCSRLANEAQGGKGKGLVPTLLLTKVQLL